MDSDLTRLTVFFEAPFWVGVFERFEGGTLSAVAAAFRQDAANPKRMQREIRRASSGCGVGTKAQQALQLQREEQKLERKTRTREQRDAEKQLKFDRRQQKRKEKHRGR